MSMSLTSKTDEWYSAVFSFDLQIWTMDGKVSMISIFYTVREEHSLEKSRVVSAKLHSG